MIASRSATGVSLRKLGHYQQGRWLFRHLCVDVPPGSFVAVVGPSGVGKSTLLSCLAGMRKPTEGEVVFARGQDECTPSAMRGRVGIIFQHLRLTENNTVLNNVLCGRLHQLSGWRTLFGFPRRMKKEAYPIIHDLGLTPYLYQAVASISGGEKQRVAIARALYQEPEIFLADEPVSQLDTYLTGRVLGLLKLQASEAGRTVFCVLHDVSLVNRFADYALSLNRDQPEKWNLRSVRS